MVQIQNLGIISEIFYLLLLDHGLSLIMEYIDLDNGEIILL